MDTVSSKAPAADVLVKPDMAAVLARTHLSQNVQSFLLPVFEALSNAMDGIVQRFGADAPSKGHISIVVQNLSDPQKLLISITDNGVGLNDDNYQSFRTPFSGYKLSQRGRGFGRFIAFKIFDRILYSTRFELGLAQSTRTFRFDIGNKEEIVFFDGTPDFSDLGLCVEFNELKQEWATLVSGMSRDEIKDEIGAHFLPYFLSRGLPEITLQFDSDPAENIANYFKSLFATHDKGEFECDFDGVVHKLSFTLSRIPKSRRFRSHSLLVSAADRIVGHARDLSTKLGAQHFVDEKSERYIIVAIVRGDVLETRLNDSRTSVDIPTKTAEAMVSAICDAITQKETTQIRKIKEEQTLSLATALSENPILRLGLKGQTLSEYVARKPNHWKAEEFVQDLALSRYRATNDLLKDIAEASNDEAQYIEKIKELAGKIDAGKKEALAEYVLHRKNIIELLNAARRFDAVGKVGSEDKVHSLIFRRFSDSTSVDYFQHNLWLIDDALAFVPYISSDRTMHGKRRSAGDKVTDLLLYDDSMILGDDQGGSLTIVEFKKPNRDDYRFGDPKHDPVKQVTDTLKKALAAGGISKVDGEHISFANVNRRQAFVIADLTASLIEVLREHDFENKYNPKIWYRYRGTEEVLIQVFGYDTLVETAKKRNQAFCKVLLDE
ncbi:ATP-binding protein [uncultured Agrobacterium sp.]|uniref:ATP-binding protein n=1 Tax=uncultured Agrobacterium sp. TaxID=157277 RepID=UPI0025F052AF|nr:ATP-binding protein [uncultured Agrobacterium sp.]